jgi:H+/Cl- antiporter ClcA
MAYTSLGPVHPVAVYIVDYFVYVALALVFAAMAAMYVRIFAPYASGGGIAEVGIECLEVSSTEY